MGERYLCQCRNFCSNDVSALQDFCCTKHPSGSGSGDGDFFRLSIAPVILVRGVYLVPKLQAILTPSVNRRTRKSSVPNRVQEDGTIAWFYQLRMAHGLGSKDADLLMKGGTGPQSISWFHQLRFGVSIPPRSVVQRLLRVPKHLFVIEGNVVPQDVKGGPS